MINIETDYMGLKLKNPLIVSSSKLTSTVDNIKECEAAGAAAVVMKSLFEEQIISDKRSMIGGLDASVHADAYDFFQQSSENFFLDQYLSQVEEAKNSVSIPVIPSLNCVHDGNWIEYASRFQEIGCKALELNLFIMPADARKSGAEIEKMYLEIARHIRSEISIPVALKLGPHFSGLANMIRTLSDEVGINAMVLFNRFYRPDVNIEKMKLMSGRIFSDPVEMALSLQWIALMSGEIKADLCAATGVHTGTDLIKQLLVGAASVQLCSTLYNNGFDQISTILEELRSWMERHEFGSIPEFQGKLCQERSDQPDEYERVQYVKVLTGLS